MKDKKDWIDEGSSLPYYLGCSDDAQSGVSIRPSDR